jgi:two-component system, OmpR family, sensor histidine kinase KdpD
VISVRRSVAGSLVSVALVAAAGAVMFPLRSHLSVATTALVFVVPVVAGVVIGGYAGGLAGLVSSFLVYDVVFVPPYYSLEVAAAQNWVALGVYAVVVVLVAQVVARLGAARREAQRRAEEAWRLFELSELLVADKSTADLFETIVTTVRQAFDLKGATLLVPVGGDLQVVAQSGQPLSKPDLARLGADSGEPVSLGTAAMGRQGVQAIALAVSDRPVGLLAVRGPLMPRAGRELLMTFLNHLALVLERAQLRDQAVRAELLEEVDRLRRSLVGAVSHDLRTPLATIKLSASNLIDPAVEFSGDDTRELLGLIDLQADRLDRLVSNLLDMTRIQAGTLELRRHPARVVDLVSEAQATLGAAVGPQRVTWRAASDLPLVAVDHVLIRQVLANLIDNAARHGPEDTPITITARRNGHGVVEVAVSDQGPGVRAEERRSIFEMFNRREAGGRAGLGLAIAKAFVEAHGETIWVDGGHTSGARFVFSLPATSVPTEGP